MKNSKITHKITQGMYALTTKGGGCIVDAVSRVGSSDDHVLVAVAVAKNNHSHKLLSENERFALSVLGENCGADIIQTFGFNSSRDIDKLAKCATTTVAEVPVLQQSLGYMVFEKFDQIENDTHTIFIGKLIEGDVFDDGANPMSYAYYQEHKDDLTKVATEAGETAWVCKACGYVYYGEEVPDDYKCPLCGLGKEYFVRKD